VAADRPSKSGLPDSQKGSRGHGWSDAAVELDEGGAGAELVGVVVADGEPEGVGVSDSSRGGERFGAHRHMTNPVGPIGAVAGAAAKSWVAVRGGHGVSVTGVTEP